MRTPAVWVGAEGRPGQLGLMTWLHKCLEERLPDVEETEWQTAAEDLSVVVPHADEVVSRYEMRPVHMLVVRVGASLVHISLSAGTVRCAVAGPHRDAVLATITLLRELILVRSLDDAVRRITLTAWHHSDGGGRQRSREIAVPSWDEIVDNYSASTQRSLRDLMGEFVPGTAGQLILWHGLPGTGKTYAIRALAWEWRRWADFHYITDPEILFGADPRYMFQVIMDAPELRTLRNGNEEERWTVLVLEDMAELLAPDARMQMGQGLSRVLNLVDGLLGQGLKLLMLVTTNEPLARLHPAVSRPGRCVAQVEFTELTPEEVKKWFEIKGEEQPGTLIGRAVTIANLHAALDGREPEQIRAVGFAS